MLCLSQCPSTQHLQKLESLVELMCALISSKTDSTRCVPPSPSCDLSRHLPPQVPPLWFSANRRVPGLSPSEPYFYAITALHLSRRKYQMPTESVTVIFQLRERERRGKRTREEEERKPSKNDFRLQLDTSARNSACFEGRLKREESENSKVQARPSWRN